MRNRNGIPSLCHISRFDILRIFIVPQPIVIVPHIRKNGSHVQQPLRGTPHDFIVSFQPLIDIQSAQILVMKIAHVNEHERIQIQNSGKHIRLRPGQRTRPRGDRKIHPRPHRSRSGKRPHVSRHRRRIGSPLRPHDPEVVLPQRSQPAERNLLEEVFLFQKITVRDRRHQDLIALQCQVGIDADDELSSDAVVVFGAADAELGGGGSDAADEGPVAVGGAVVVDVGEDDGG
mmetsp:Transcript_28140/g.59198  ORF Transcript_28140/g.59198 Transcript_28140/m.59198 type:complete len:232 (-) Transcript_28140:306-1001(-)